MKPARLLITGSREWPEVAAYRVASYLDKMFSRVIVRRELIIVHGKCHKGVDLYADQWCTEVGCEVERYPADWNKYGRRAGFIRNSDMVRTRPDMCLAFIKDNSAGATMCADIAKQAGIRTVRVRY